MTDTLGTTGLILNEPLLWEKGRKGRCGFSLPRRDVPVSSLDPDLTGSGPDFPDLSEVDLVRHYTRLSTWNFGVDTGMYPLGSCTMKYNPKTNERQAGLPGFAAAHPLLPPELAQGALALMHDLQRYLAEITGMDAVSLQPAAGAHGELTGMLLIYAYHRSKGSPAVQDHHPRHGPRHQSGQRGLVRLPPGARFSPEREGVLTAEVVAAVMDEETAGIMVTNPNTLGLFEQNIRQITDIVHAKGGLVYCDGANMNAVMGIVDLKAIGVDVLHLNLHKTFSTPHGGGGPGSGPVCVHKRLEPFLPVPRVIKEGDTYTLSEEFPQSIGKLDTFHGHFGIMVRAYSYILSLGPDGLKKASQLAVLNANYIKERLKGTFHLAHDRPCMHECVFSDKNQASYGVTTLDMAKRLDGLRVPSTHHLLSAGRSGRHHDRAHRDRMQGGSRPVHRRHATDCPGSRGKPAAPARRPAQQQSPPPGRGVRRPQAVPDGMKG